MSKYAYKKNRQAEEARLAKADEDERKRIAKYNRRRDEARNGRLNNRKGIREMSAPELIFVAREIERKLKSAWQVAEVIGELRRRFTISLGLSGDIAAALGVKD